ncbi:dynein heavy chain 3, axonemal [Trichonephila clavata]|uniref:Dynein heavy chain 3, axonemal n=1 Tax=Trichonephila clavata TaxID=2740835 RepID=A0A8X6J2A8_TRICU|nr:dynein heavy chain 3, axonemal [Trichonephila clavata]
MRKKSNLKEREQIASLNYNKPMSPLEQKKHKKSKLRKSPSQTDIERYWHYVHYGIDDKDIPPLKLSLETLCQQGKIRKDLLSSFPETAKELFNEAKKNYHTAVKQGIVDYVLLDKSERQRLKIKRCPSKWPQIFVQTPLPWNNVVHSARKSLQSKAFLLRPCIKKISYLWAEKYQNRNLIQASEFNSSPLPPTTEGFRYSVEKQCREAQEFLRFEWIEECVQILVKNRKIDWEPLVSRKPGASSKKIERYFSSVAVIMSSMMRELVIKSVLDWMQLIHKYAVGNDISQMEEIKFPNFPILTVHVIVKESTIGFEMAYEEWEEEIVSVIYKLLQISKYMPRADKILLRVLENEKMNLFDVPPNDQVVEMCINSVKKDLKYNHIGLQQYLEHFEKFDYIINGTFEEDIDNFLNVEEEIDVQILPEKIKEIQLHKVEINNEKSNVNLSIINLNCDILKKQLCEKIDAFCERLISFQAEVNAKHTQWICDEFHSMQSELIKPLSNTEELVGMINTLKVSQARLDELVKEIKKAVKRILFLMDNTILTEKDFLCHSTMLRWPKGMKKLFKVTSVELRKRRDEAETNLVDRIKMLENNVDFCERKIRNLPLIQAINEEERLLSRDLTFHPNIPTMFAQKEPCEKLWTTAYEFFKNYEIWYYGPFTGLNAEEIRDSKKWENNVSLLQNFC